MEIKVVKIEEAGYESAMFGLSLNKNQDRTKMHDVAAVLSDKDMGHNKFLESMYVWLDVRAPRYWWQDADTYRLSSKQSQSTNHTILRRPLGKEDFEDRTILDDTLWYLNTLINEKNFLELKKHLPEGFMQRRCWCLSYKTLSNVIHQRQYHKLPHWQSFNSQIMAQVTYPEFLIKRLKDVGTRSK